MVRAGVSVWSWRTLEWSCPGSVNTIQSRSILFSQTNLLELSRA
jgi:hypothetical protein